MRYLLGSLFLLLGAGGLQANSSQLPPIDMVTIPEGSFKMGNSEVEDEVDFKKNPVSGEVRLDAFRIGKYEVTKGEWDEVRAWAQSYGYTDMAKGAGKDLSHPVQKVSWYDVVKWCNLRSELDGLVPCYRLGVSVMKTGKIAPSVIWSANGYRLPTEAEWEKAARGRSKDMRFAWGDRISFANANYRAIESSVYWLYDDSKDDPGFHPDYEIPPFPYTSPVGAFEENDYGLYDMSGNIAEWCWDFYEEIYSGIRSNPRGPLSGSNRVYRGGAWDMDAGLCRSAGRNYATPETSWTNFIGFRVARTIDLAPSIVGITTTPTKPEIEKPVKFSVNATGANLRYQWYKNGAAIDGAIGSEYTISSLKVSDSGSYKVKVWNSAANDSKSVYLDAGLKIAISPEAGKPRTITIKRRQGVRYQISTNFGARTFIARKLPSGLKINATTGVILGRVSKVGTYRTTITAQKKQGKKVINQTSTPITFIVQ
jgi:formylglycine-generating enzyme required for sulfatase activity